MKLSPVKKSSHRNVEKYASKFCAEVVDNVIQEHLEKVSKNANTTEKWANKMKSSVLRKISACSKIAFLPHSQRPEILQELIEEELDKISVKTAKIKELLSQNMRQAHLADVQVVSRSAPPTTGRFDKSVAHIGTQLAKVAHQLHSTKTSMDARLESLRSTLSEVQANWKPPAGTSPRSADGALSPTGSKKSKGKLPTNSPMKNAGALGKLHEHLEKV
jgi:hypothetical protein